MTSTSKTRDRQTAARSELASLYKAKSHLNVVHYSCESFYDNPSGGSMRVTSIAVMNVGSEQSVSFSVHQAAEQMGIATSEIELKYNVIELKMLEEFYSYIQNRPDDHWMHWNMRDTNYGFPALAHRTRVLGGEPVTIPESRLFNLPEALRDIYGDQYAPHGSSGRLNSLIQLNGFNHKDFLSGRAEAEAFALHQYVRLHQSTLRKVRLIGAIGELAWEGKLKTTADWWSRRGASAWGAFEDTIEHPITKVVTFLFAIVGAFVTIHTVGQILGWLPSN